MGEHGDNSETLKYHRDASNEQELRLQFTSSVLQHILTISYAVLLFRETYIPVGIN